MSADHPCLTRPIANRVESRAEPPGEVAISENGTTVKNQIAFRLTEVATENLNACMPA